MPADFYPANEEVVELVERVIKLYHAPLEEARIGLLFRDEAPRSGKRVTMGQAKKVAPAEKALIPYDFIIWFARDIWESITPQQRFALVDHELCHCGIELDDGGAKTKMIPHEVEEFNCIIERHGFWWPGAHQTQQAISQAPLPFVEPEARRGRVEASTVLPASLEKAA